ncbi:hypothetical protein VP01_4515g2 [Puccinia sorghi]|uniref:Uncharacterized protein n=1 Tax=Puccinia sorghi TaxID=27349 RepID=A0A0L6UP01_9BASI|nr:hypothetical protein VP01_4515g2 [Puccinia sorghi]
MQFSSRQQNRQLLGYFKEIQFTQADWMQIKHLNDELKVTFQSSYQGNEG